MVLRLLFSVRVELSLTGLLGELMKGVLVCVRKPLGLANADAYKGM